MSTDTRQRMVDTAVRLFRSQGYAATSWRGLVAEAGTPWGSVQHHFPGGKQELAVAALETAADSVLTGIRLGFDKHASAGEAIAWWFGKAQLVLERSDYAQACPIGTLALDSSDPVVAEASRQALERWRTALADRLQDRGYADSEALALSVLTSLQGALVLAKGLRSSEPLELAAQTMRDWLA